MIDTNTTADGPTDAGQKISEGVRNAIHDAAQAGFAESQRHVPVAFGDLKQSGELERGSDFGRFGYTAAHARFVEAGTAPHYPPIEPLKDWAEQVLGDRQAAYAVQQKIAEEGTPAQPFVRPGRDAAKRELQRRGVAAHIEDEL